MVISNGKKIFFDDLLCFARRSCGSQQNNNEKHSTVDSAAPTVTFGWFLPKKTPSFFLLAVYKSITNLKQTEYIHLQHTQTDEVLLQ